MKTISIGLVAVAVIFSLTSCSTPSPKPARDLSASIDADDFVKPSSDVLVVTSEGTVYKYFLPRPPGLEPQISFWRKVYADWRIDQIVLHDDKYMDLIYDVFELPGEVYDGSYTSEQRRFVQAELKGLKTRLQELERKITVHEPFTPWEQRLARRITASSGGRVAIFGASERLRYQRGLRERFRRGLEISGRYEEVFRKIFREAGLPEDLAYLPHVESSFQERARSSVGATGMWQFTRSAARIYMNDHPALDERLDPVASARGAARYLRDAYDRLGNWSLAVTSYNHGINGMARAKEEFGTDFMQILNHYRGAYFGFASRNFYAEFLAARDIASQPERFFPQSLVFEKPLERDRLILIHPLPVPDLALNYNVEENELQAMNPAWTTAARRGRVALPAGTEVWLPAGTLTRTAQMNDMMRQVSVHVDEAQKTRLD